MAADKDSQPKVQDVLKTKFNELLRNPDLKRFLCTPCSDALESIFDNSIETWLSHHHDLDEKDNCLFGTPFEYYIVSLMGQFETWKFIAWRGDKFIDKSKDSKTFPASNRYADLLYEYAKEDETTGFKEGNRIAIECKWTEYDGKSEDSSAAKRIKNIRKSKYHLYSKNALQDGACSFYLAIGVGWDDEKSAPKAVYLVPASAIKKIANPPFKTKNNPDADIIRIVKIIKRYRLQGTPKFSKEESLLSKYFQEGEIAEIISGKGGMEERIKVQKQDLGVE